jgi:hypothetical protein
MGALPFRVWQMFDEAVADLRAGHADRWVASMGLMAHYVGDACQPLHVSFLHHGREGHAGEDKVHSVYETQMLDRNTLDLVLKVNEATKHLKAIKSVNNGFEAAVAVVDLMRRTFEFIDPMEVIDAYNETDGRGRIKHMWEVLGQKTAESIAAGAQTLAMLWDSAWQAGGAPNKTKAITHEKLMQLYNDATFAASERLDTMAANGRLKKPASKAAQRITSRKRATRAMA